MGQAKRRGTFEQRKALAVKTKQLQLAKAEAAKKKLK